MYILEKIQSETFCQGNLFKLGGKCETPTLNLDPVRVLRQFLAEQNKQIAVQTQTRMQGRNFAFLIARNTG